MRIAAIIPARFKSSRFEGKPLALIQGKPMIQWVYDQVEKCRVLNDVIVATDDKRIAVVVQRFGGNVVMTSKKHSSGTERLWEVLQKNDYDAAINIQGDEPIISDKLIFDLFQELKTGKNQVITAAFLNSDYQDFLSKNVVKVVFNNQNRALYFSRSPIPFTKENIFKGFYQHIGVYGYLRSSLDIALRKPPSHLEKTEKLEQLRFLENDISIRVIKTNYQSIGVDVPEDIIKIEEIIKDKNE